MKKSLVIAVAAVLLFGLVGCSQEKKVSFTATVLENTGSSVLVEPSADSDEIKSSNRISVSVKDCEILDSEGNAISIDDIKVDSKIEITYGGEILESYPAQISDCSQIKLAK